MSRRSGSAASRALSVPGASEVAPVTHVESEIAEPAEEVPASVPLTKHQSATLGALEPEVSQYRGLTFRELSKWHGQMVHRYGMLSIAYADGEKDMSHAQRFIEASASFEDHAQQVLSHTQSPDKRYDIEAMMHQLSLLAGIMSTIGQ